MRHQPEQFEARGWAEHLSSRLCIELDRRVDRLRRDQRNETEIESLRSAQRGEGDTRMGAYCGFVGGLKDASSLRRLFGERDAIEAYVRTLMESHE